MPPYGAPLHHLYFFSALRLFFVPFVSSSLFPFHFLAFPSHARTDNIKSAQGEEKPWLGSLTPAVEL